ncbi:uncharacterized protein LOC106738386 isoform X1 [Alligator mississippiensis]|uniref:uncharacterized protein LOC106738386 isoform X1 n=2 Tax=Alligator mississippiensis TaxID=8496 RepID=UPI0028775076|nr:uncharacterized protein LOC106738386 isoform X1 [Alligator mississippiensis]
MLSPPSPPTRAGQTPASSSLLFPSPPLPSCRQSQGRGWASQLITILEKSSSQRCSTLDLSLGCTMTAEEEPSHTMMKSELSYEDESKVREEAELLMKPEADWEKFLLPAPIIVALLGQLVCIPVEKGDFSICEHAPSGGYRYFKETKSFKVCLQEVCDRVWDAFQLGRNKATLIRRQLKNVPRKMEDLIQGFLQDVNMKRDPFIVQIEDMQRKAKECKTLAEEAKAKFMGQEDVLQELFQACLNARQGKNKVLETVQTELKEVKSQMEPARDEQDRAEQKHVKLEAQGNEALKTFFSDIEKRPSSLGIVCVEKDKTHFMEKHSTKLERSQEMQDRAWQEMGSNYERMKDLNKRTTEIQCAMNRCEFRERDLERCDSILEEGLEALRNLHQQWKKMVQFFQMISNLVDFCLNWHIRECLDSDENLQQVTRAFSAISVVQLVQLISHTYVTIVQKYLMELLRQVGRLLGKDRSSFHAEKAQLDGGCEGAREALTRLVGELKGNFQSDLSTRLETIEKVKLKLNP